MDSVGQLPVAAVQRRPMSQRSQECFLTGRCSRDASRRMKELAIWGCMTILKYVASMSAVADSKSSHDVHMLSRPSAH